MSGKVAFVLKPIKVQSLVKEVIEANKAFADSYGVRVRLNFASTACEIRADFDWVFQIVTNLLSNAIKFSPSGEDVVVATEKHGGKVRITVRDHGPGIPNDFEPHIFEKFAQANATDARQRGGTGLGLSIVKQIVMHLGGQIDFCDAPGGGTIFPSLLPPGVRGCGGIRIRRKAEYVRTRHERTIGASVTEHRRKQLSPGILESPPFANEEERFRRLVDGVKDYAILMLDPDGIITTWNKALNASRGTGRRDHRPAFFVFLPPRGFSARNAATRT